MGVFCLYLHCSCQSSPDVTTSPTLTLSVLAINPKTLNTTNPAKKLVPQLMQLTMMASLLMKKSKLQICMSFYSIVGLHE